VIRYQKHVSTRFKLKHSNLFVRRVTTYSIGTNVLMQGTVTASRNTPGAGKIEDSRQQTIGQRDHGGEKDAGVQVVAGGYDMRDEDEDLEKREGNEWQSVFYTSSNTTSPAACWH
jgi:hypothetical protein